MSYEDLGPAPDITTIDDAAMDFGNDPAAAAAPVEPPPTDKELEAEVAAANAKADEKVAAPESSPEGQPRDDKGRFAEKEARIPKSRFDEAVGKEREAREAAERRAAELEARLQKQEAAKGQAQARSEQLAAIDAQVAQMEEKYQELLLDGNTKEAAALMREIRMAERQVAKMEAQEESAAVVSQELERQRFGVAVARLEADYPVLNPQSDAYDNDLVQMVLLVHNDMVRQGVAPSEALVTATSRVMARVQPQAAPKQEPGLGAAKPDARQQQAVTKALEAQRQQPASMKEVGFDSDTRGEKGLPDVTKMSADEFDALPQATKDRLMGNLV